MMEMNFSLLKPITPQRWMFLCEGMQCTRDTATRAVSLIFTHFSNNFLYTKAIQNGALARGAKAR